MSERPLSIPFYNIKAEATGRIRSGVAAVFGNVDSVGDRIMPGAFRRTINAGTERVKFLWNHDYSFPPIGMVRELRELSRDELPDKVLEKAPEATGGLYVKREYFKTDLANAVLEAVDAGAVNEMSFAFDIPAGKSELIDEEYEDEHGEPVKRSIRLLHELKLFDVSDVNWGANSATVAVGAKFLRPMPLGVIAGQLSMLENELKAGRRNSDSDAKLISLIHDTAVNLGAACETKDEAGELPKADANTTDEKPEPVGTPDTSLSPEWLELQKAKTQALRLRMHTNI